MAHERYIMVDGPDGAGKGVILEAISDSLFETAFYPMGGRIIPQDVILAFEPTYEGIGAVIRNEIIKKGTGRSYSAATTAQAYALDREVLYRTTVLPALKKQKFVVQDRGLPASLAYQSAQAEISKEKLTVEDILALPGNKLALENAPGLLIIPDVDVKIAMKRLESRDKNDNSIFEVDDFQRKVKEFYHSQKFQDIFNMAGTRIEYISTGTNVEDTKKRSMEVVRKYLRQIKP